MSFTLPVTGTTLTLGFAAKAPKQPETLLIPVTKGEALEVPVTQLVPKGLLEALERVGATGKHGEVTRVLFDDQLIVAFGLGHAEELDDDAVRRAAGELGRSLTGVREAVISTEFGVAPIVEGLLLGGYTYAGFKAAGDEEQKPAVVTVVGEKSAKEEFETAQIVAESVNFARDLVNTPANHLYPEVYAELVQAVGKEAGLKVEVLDEKALEKGGYGGLIAVGKGSHRPPRLVHLEWKPRRAKKKVALVGKGITFDTGGISLKPGSKMEDMISDMGGSAMMLGATIAAARLGVPVQIDTWLSMAENMPSGGATRPGDVITHYGGKTSEIINTDAEGRVVLADALARASEEKPDYLIEASTLTGAQLVALGARTAGVMGSDEFRDHVAAVARDAGEPAWAMPLPEETADDLKSPIADVRNSHSSRFAGMLVAGRYIEAFVGEGIQWAHVDIAGPAFNGGSAHAYTPKRATGYGVRTIVDVLRSLS
ncbi:leucyl aminopeptidase [Corynebacterium cystitidis]|uniref:Probable cytosol aminopeptidase n=1 Tax=Corynebacterium cystitidis DSM 20524 TaxID=1121357 RepID=A0A1H9NML9_9CORY|nr:leucyl aminopeptidase [Corynebacterium cystitidis]WJY82815.1 Cytosol aminopeptidase [Corynebacterium cystitidis DSM 20524]SER36889.1 leucyl aminopeptidase [Corynebacterium cystitidis DSM 20524]SNV70221.1 multifunctional aminopeptidase A [Corynebacterium cystitidis]